MPTNVHRPTGPAAPTTPTTPPQPPSTSTTNPSPQPASTPSTTEANAGILTTDMARTIGTSPAAGAASTEPLFQTFFAPYDDTRKVELELLDEVIAARKTDPNTYPEGQNPYKINYAVYNISSSAILEKLADAERAGVDVQILIEDHQLDPKKHWNQGDDYLRSQGFTFSGDHSKLSAEERNTVDLIGIKKDTLMHLKSRIIQYPDPETGQTVKKVLTGSMNPGESAVRNDENLNLLTDPRIVDRYIEMYEAVRDGKTIRNDFDPDKPINAMFTPAHGDRVTDQIFKWIDQEDEAIFLSVFALRNLTTPSERTSLVKKLKAAKERGVEVAVITDRKMSDGVDSNGNQTYFDDWTDDKLREAGIPTYEAVNDAGPYNAMHAKCAIFGLSEMKVITDTGNWSKAALSDWRDNRPQNEESYLFLDSKELDNNATGLRYLGNWLHILRKYAPQNPDEPGAEELINRLSQHPNWPRVRVDFSVMAHTYMGQEVYVTGNHPALGNWLQEGPGLKLNTQPGRYPFWESGGSLDLPFGTNFQYKIVKKNPDGTIDWEPGKNAFLIVDPMDSRQGTQGTGGPYHQVRSDEF